MLTVNATLTLMRALPNKTFLKSKHVAGSIIVWIWTLKEMEIYCNMGEMRNRLCCKREKWNNNKWKETCKLKLTRSKGRKMNGKWNRSKRSLEMSREWENKWNNLLYQKVCLLIWFLIIQVERQMLIECLRLRCIIKICNLMLISLSKWVAVLTRERRHMLPISTQWASWAVTLDGYIYLEMLRSSNKMYLILQWWIQVLLLSYMKMKDWLGLHLRRDKYLLQRPILTWLKLRPQDRKRAWWGYLQWVNKIKDHLLYLKSMMVDQ